MTVWHWIAVAVIALTIWMGRYEIVSTNSAAYILDRWTGDASLASGYGLRKLKEQE